MRKRKIVFHPIDDLSEKANLTQMDATDPIEGDARWLWSGRAIHFDAHTYMQDMRALGDAKAVPRFVNEITKNRTTR
jgi:gluconate kinase